MYSVILETTEIASILPILPFLKRFMVMCIPTKWQLANLYISYTDKYKISQPNSRLSLDTDPNNLQDRLYIFNTGIKQNFQP